MLKYVHLLDVLYRAIREALLGYTPPPGGDPIPVAPDPPTSLSAVAGDGQATVSFTAPVITGTSPVTSYAVTSSPGGISAAGTASPIVVTGLTNGVSYTFVAYATSADGTSVASAPSAAVTPVLTPAVPGAPTAASATAGDAQATVSFTPPAYAGTQPITAYTVTSSPGGLTATGASSPLVVTGLTNGLSYSFTVVATNSVGNSAPSNVTNSVQPAETPRVPGAPTIGLATAGDGSASVAFTAPVDPGTTAITSYIATSSPGGITASRAISPINVLGLSNGVPYTFTVRAVNSVGTGAPSAASDPVTPEAAPPPDLLYLTDENDVFLTDEADVLLTS